MAMAPWRTSPFAPVKLLPSTSTLQSQRLAQCVARSRTTGFQPLAGAMAAALPYCDAVVPAHSLLGIQQLFGTLADLAFRR